MHNHHNAIYALHKQEQQPLCAGAYLPMPITASVPITASIATNGKTITAICTCNAALENHSDLPTQLAVVQEHVLPGAATSSQLQLQILLYCLTDSSRTARRCRHPASNYASVVH